MLTLGCLGGNGETMEYVAREPSSASQGVMYIFLDLGRLIVIGLSRWLLR
jgi:hypothetical protein